MKKGFTLVELLGVIVIIGVIALITIPVLTNTISQSEEKTYKKQIDLIEKSAKEWGIEHIDYLPAEDSGVKKAISLQTLLNSGKIQNATIQDPRTKEEMNGCVVISYNEEYKQYEYKYVEESEECTIPESISFEEDSWETIVNNVKIGNTNNYNVGDTKEIDMGSFGKYIVRIANKSTPSKCNTTGFSQTACGFVLEFEDRITTLFMNSDETNVGGWEASEPRTYINNTIYNALPTEIRNNIIDTTVVSGHGNTEGETNFITIDKLYLLSIREVYGETKISNEYIDTASSADVTRQLDYYENLGVTQNSSSGAIKKRDDGEATWWWLRSASRYDNTDFYYVNWHGGWSLGSAHEVKTGVTPAFRLG